MMVSCDCFDQLLPSGLSNLGSAPVGSYFFTIIMVVSEKHCFYCFDVLAAHFEGREPNPPEFDNSD
jgi:hypothetical protein